MKNNKRILLGISIAIFIHVIAIVLGKIIKLDSDVLPFSFITHSTILIFSAIAIKIFAKDISFNFSIPDFRKIFRPFLIGLGITIVTNIILTIVIKLLGFELDTHLAVSQMTGFQIFAFVFIYASISEEMLYRGFLLNFIKSLISGSVSIFRRNVSYAIIISGIMFGLSHSVLLLADVSYTFVVRTVIFTMILGVVAGYYQEKNNNTLFAILVHMGGNFMAIIALLIMQ